MRLKVVTKSAVSAGVAASAGMSLLGGGMDAYEIDKLFSYSIGDLRIRPQFDISFVFNDNIFFAPSKAQIPYIELGNPAFIVFPRNGGYIYSPSDGLPVVPYQGFIQQQVFTATAPSRLVTASPIFTSALYPPPTVPVPAGTFDFLAGFAPGPGGFRTNVLTLQPRVADVIGTVSPGIKLQYGADEFNFVDLEYNNDNTRYLDQGIAPAPMHRIRSKLQFEHSRLRLEASQNVAYLSSFLGGGSNLGRRLVDRWNADTNAKLTYDSSAKTDVYTTAQYSFTDYVSAIPLYSPNTWRGGLGASYKPTERLFVFIEGHYAQTALSANTPSLEGAPYSQTYGGFVGVRGKFTERIEGSIRGGYEVREFPNVPGDSSFAIPAADIAVTYMPRDTTLVSLTYSRKSDVASQVARQAVAYDSMRLGVRQTIGASAKWLASLDVGYTLGDFGSLTTPLLTVLEPVAGSDVRILTRRAVDYKRTETVLTYSAGIAYSPRRWLRASLSYEFEDYSNVYADRGLGDFYIPSYDAHRVMLALQIGY